MKKLRLKKGILRLLFLIFIIIFVYSFINILSWHDDSKKSKKIEEDIQEFVNINPAEGVFEVDFKELKRMNSDTVAYLIVNDTNINYPVVKGKDNNFYLNHSFTKEKSEAGTLFMDSNNKFDGSDYNIIIYGHNRLDGIMLGSLKNVLKEEWYSKEENLFIKLINENKAVDYKIFSMYKIKEEDYYINTSFNDESFRKFVNTIKGRSVHDFGEDLTNVEQVLTLSTCTLVDGYRFVVHAYKV